MSRRWSILPVTYIGWLTSFRISRKVTQLGSPLPLHIYKRAAGARSQAHELRAADTDIACCRRSPPSSAPTPLASSLRAETADPKASVATDSSVITNFSSDRDGMSLASGVGSASSSGRIKSQDQAKVARLVGFATGNPGLLQPCPPARALGPTASRRPSSRVPAAAPAPLPSGPDGQPCLLAPLEMQRIASRSLERGCRGTPSCHLRLPCPHHRPTASRRSPLSCCSQFRMLRRGRSKAATTPTGSSSSRRST